MVFDIVLVFTAVFTVTSDYAIIEAYANSGM